MAYGDYSSNPRRAVDSNASHDSDDWLDSQVEGRIEFLTRKESKYWSQNNNDRVARESMVNELQGLLARKYNMDMAKRSGMTEETESDADIINRMADNLTYLGHRIGSMSPSQAREALNHLYNDKSSPLFDQGHPDHGNWMDRMISLQVMAGPDDAYRPQWVKLKGRGIGNKKFDAADYDLPPDGAER